MTDTFTVPAPPKELDLVWVLDEDDDYDQVQSVAALLPQLVDALNAAQVDWQMAVTSTDTCDGGSSDLGFFEPCDHCISQAASDALYITPATADAGDALVNLFDLFDQSMVGNDAGELRFCEGLNGDEHFFDSIADAFSATNLSGHNAGLIRAGADLSIVLVNGDAEDDANGAGAGGPYLTSLKQVTSLVESLKPDAGMVSVSYVNNGAGAIQAAQQIGQLVQATNGSEIDSSQAEAVWQDELLDATLFAGGTAVFRLSAQPASQGEIEVYVNGVLVADWSYDPFQQEIIFDPANLPAAGSSVTVTYRTGCP